jgi:hypothetical protein
MGIMIVIAEDQLGHVNTVVVTNIDEDTANIGPDNEE